MIILILIATILVVGFVAFMSLRNSEKRESEEHEKRLDSLEQQLSSQRDEQTQQMLEQAKAVRRNKSEPPEISLRIARNGQDLGEMKLGVVKSMLSDGKLAPEDFYLDSTSNEWVPLECHPSLVR